MTEIEARNQEAAIIAEWLRETAPQFGHEALASAIERRAYRAGTGTASIAAMVETGNVMAEELEYFADYARKSAEFEGDVDAAGIAIHAWQFALASYRRDVK